MNQTSSLKKMMQLVYIKAEEKDSLEVKDKEKVLIAQKV